MRFSCVLFILFIRFQSFVCFGSAASPVYELLIFVSRGDLSLGLWGFDGV
jgi:hypothetical protein